MIELPPIIKISLTIYGKEIEMELKLKRKDNSWWWFESINNQPISLPFRTKKEAINYMISFIENLNE